jgi:hypothetical protein
MKTDRLCFPLVTLAIVAALILAVYDPTPSHAQSHTAAAATVARTN